jgi:hypothetical protein
MFHLLRVTMDTDSPLLQPAPRTVRPRTRQYRRLPVVAISHDHTLSEDGEIGSVGTLIDTLHAAPPTLYVKVAAADFVAELDKYYAEWDADHWQWRASIHERAIVRPDGLKVAARVSTAIHYFGFKGGNYHKIIDPVTMYGHKLDTIWPGDQSAIERLLAWGITLRDFCHKNGLDIRPTIGSISSQFLTDRRFYPRKRRKVPAAINERARENLPGNHYVLTVQPSSKREFTAHYLDQHRAHHYHARTAALPDSNYLYAYGRFTDLEECDLGIPVEGFYGLYCLDLELPARYRRSHWITKTERQFVYSNELPHLEDLGYRVTGIRAAWGSRKQDTGLSKYAQWAGKQLDHYGDKPWIKPLLLATYGTLATRPTTAEAVFRMARRGEPVDLFTGGRVMSGKRVTAPKKLEPGIANVIHRGMIEAATRSESIGLAQWLTAQGHRILSIYADAVIVEHDDDLPLPSLLPPWRSKTTLNHLQFISQQAFVSGEMTKLPGVTSELRKYHLPLAREHGTLPVLS